MTTNRFPNVFWFIDTHQKYPGGPRFDATYYASYELEPAVLIQQILEYEHGISATIRSVKDEDNIHFEQVLNAIRLLECHLNED